MNRIRTIGVAFAALALLTAAIPSLAAKRRDAAATSALATIDQAQNTLIAIQKLIDGIQARHAAGTPTLPAGQ